MFEACSRLTVWCWFNSLISWSSSFERLTSCSKKKDFHLYQLPLACSKCAPDPLAQLDPLEPLIGYLAEPRAELLVMPHLTKPLAALLPLILTKIPALVN